MTSPSRRKIIKIDEEKCNGCEACIPNCPEGALQVIDGKARLVSDLFCDGLGACIGRCPQGAIEVEEREALPYDERQVMANILPKGRNTILAHLEHLKAHGAESYYREAVLVLQERGLENAAVSGKGIGAGQAAAASSAHQDSHGGCPGSRLQHWDQAATDSPALTTKNAAPSRLRTWPVQLNLVPAQAPFLRNADLLIAADCTGFAYPDFHEAFLKDRVLIIACPKLDDTDHYLEKLSDIFRNNEIRSILVLHMEVPCCFGLAQLVHEALERSEKHIPLDEKTISLQGEVME